MKKTPWLVVLIAVGSAAVFFGLDGPLRLSKWWQREKAVGGSMPGAGESRWAEDPAVSALAGKIVAITIERTACYGTCPVYVFRLERSHKAFYDGQEYVSRKGRYVGKSYYFDPLAYFAAAHLLLLKDNYERPVTDNPTTILTIELTDGKKCISDYANSGPNDLFIFCTAIDRVESSIEWIPENTANQTPQPAPAGVVQR